MNLDNVKKGATLMREALALLHAGPLDYYLRELAGAHDFMMARCCPFKAGDRVELSVTPEINERDSWGWMGSKHFLIEGAAGVISSAECGSNGFSFGVLFDNESWLDRDGLAQPTRDKHAYHFRETSLRLAAGRSAP